MLVGDMLTRVTKWYPDKTASVCEGVRLTYEEMNRRTNAVANALIEFGIRPQDRVAVLCHNTHQYLEVVFAAAKIGAVATNLNWRLSTQELANLINHSDARILIFSKRFEKQVAPIQKEKQAGFRFVAIGGSVEGAVDYEDLIRANPGGEPEISASIDENDTVIQMYTSGTTGAAKGVMLTHRNILSNTTNTVIELEMGRSLVYMNILPLFHVAIFLPLNCVFVGGTNIYLPDFEPGATLAMIQKEKATAMGTVPAMVKFLIEHPTFREFDLSSFRLLMYAAAPMPLAVLRDAMQKLPHCRFAQFFGMTETSPVTHILIPEEHVTEGPDYKVKRLTSVGRPILNVQSRVVDEQGKECPPGVVGEVVDSSSTVMKGYYKMPEATAEAIRDGWLHTGDMGYVDDYGYLYLADRKKDMIISGGENIYPVEVEMCIMQMDGVADVAVIGIPDENWGESVKAIVVRKPGAEITAEGVIDHCKKNIAAYKRPKTVDFIEALPRNVMGKLQKNILRDPFWAGREKKI